MAMMYDSLQSDVTLMGELMRVPAFNLTRASSSSSPHSSAVQAMDRVYPWVYTHEMPCISCSDQGLHGR
jgi:hypothetical protein